MFLSPPELLADHHQIEDFTSGEVSPDDWLKRRARANQASGASRTYVVSEEVRVIGYHPSLQARSAWQALLAGSGGRHNDWNQLCNRSPST